MLIQSWTQSKRLKTGNSMELIKEDKKGKVYRSDEIKIFYRNIGSISGDNNENPEELIYLISGRARVTLEDKVDELEAPAKITFPPKTYHKIEALQDIVFVLFN